MPKARASGKKDTNVPTSGKSLGPEDLRRLNDFLGEDGTADPPDYKKEAKESLGRLAAKVEKTVRQMKATAPLHELAYRMGQDPNYKPSIEESATALGSALVGMGIVKPPKPKKRYFVSEGVIDGYAACLVMETNLGGEPFGVVRCYHPLTKKAAELARLFIAAMPAPTGETKMAIARQTPLSVSKRGDNPLTNIVEPRDRKRDKDSDFYIQAGGNDSFELGLWTSVALSACDQFQERRIRRKR